MTRIAVWHEHIMQYAKSASTLLEPILALEREYLAKERGSGVGGAA
jgi:hypothetical protein